MKRIFCLLAIAATMCLAALTPAQIQPATSVEGIVSTHGKLSGVVTQRIGSFHNVFNIKGNDFDVRPFVGVNFSNGNALTGGGAIAFQHPVRLATEAYLSGGLFYAATNKKQGDFGIYLSLSWYLGK